MILDIQESLAILRYIDVRALGLHDDGTEH
jgi:hypothetical protein